MNCLTMQHRPPGVGIFWSAPAQRGWQRWQGSVAALYYQRVTLPLQWWVAAGRPPQFQPQLPWWQPLVWHYLVITGWQQSRRRERPA